MITEILFFVFFLLVETILTYIVIKYLKSQIWMERQLRKMEDELLELRETEPTSSR